MLGKKVIFLFLTLISVSLQNETVKDKYTHDFNEGAWMSMAILCLFSTLATIGVVKYINEKPIVDISYITLIYKDTFIIGIIQIYANVIMALAYEWNMYPGDVFPFINRFVSIYILLSWLLCSTMKLLSKFSLKTKETIDESLGTDDEALSKIRKLNALVSLLLSGVQMAILGFQEEEGVRGTYHIALILIILNIVIPMFNGPKKSSDKKDKVVQAVVIFLVMVSSLGYICVMALQVDISMKMKLDAVQMSLWVRIFITSMVPILVLAMNGSIASWAAKKMWP